MSHRDLPTKASTNPDVAVSNDAGPPPSSGGPPPAYASEPQRPFEPLGESASLTQAPSFSSFTASPASTSNSKTTVDVNADDITSRKSHKHGKHTDENDEEDEDDDSEDDEDTDENDDNDDSIHRDHDAADMFRTVSLGRHTTATGGETPPSNAADPEQLARVASGPVYSVFSDRMKMYIIVMVTVTSFISPMTANIYFPALTPIAQDLGVTVGLINLTLTTYMIFQGIAPTLFGDFGDMAGRRPAFLIAMAIYTVINIGLALQNNYAALLVLRMLQSCGSSGTLALGYAVVADIAVSAERGKYMGLVGAGINIGPAVSPVLGGVLAEFLGWRSIFWFCCIFSGCLLLPYALTVPETARNVVGNGSIKPRWPNMTLLDFWRQWRQRRQTTTTTSTATTTATTASAPVHIRFPNPLRTLHVVLEKDMSLILAYAAILYVVFIMIVATLSTIFSDIYHLNELQIGLCYLPYGVGCCVAAIAQGHLLDWNYRRTARQIGFVIDYKRGDDLAAFPIERARLLPMLPMLVAGVATVITYGWVLEYRLPLAVPLVLLFLVGLTVVGSFSILNTLIMDLYPQAPATAVAAVNLVRCLLGAGVMAFIEAMLQRLGRGWNFTFWALLVVVTSPMLWVVNRWGPQWREERRVRLAAKKAHKDAEKMRKAAEAAAAAASAADPTAVVSEMTQQQEQQHQSPLPRVSRERSASGETMGQGATEGTGELEKGPVTG